jgi:hypothetical protein
MMVEPVIAQNILVRTSLNGGVSNTDTDFMQRVAQVFWLCLPFSQHKGES